MKKRKNQLLYRSMADKDDTRWSYAAGLDEMCSSGCYLLQLRHNCPGTTLPLPACDEEHYITATLIVTESGTDELLQRNRLIGQTLIMPDCNDGRTRIFNRTLKKGNSNRTWNNWNNIAQSSIDDEITSTEDLIASVTELKLQTKEIKTDLSSETARTKEAEAAITEDAILSGSMNVTPDTDRVTLSYRNIDGTEVSDIDIQAATTEKAGVMSAEDKKTIVDASSSIGMLVLEQGGINKTNGSEEESSYRLRTSFLTPPIRIELNEGFVVVGVCRYNLNKEFIAGSTTLDNLNKTEFNNGYLYRVSFRKNDGSLITINEQPVKTFSSGLLQVANETTEFINTYDSIANIEASIDNDIVILEQGGIDLNTGDNVANVQKRIRTRGYFKAPLIFELNENYEIVGIIRYNTNKEMVSRVYDINTIKTYDDGFLYRLSIKKTDDTEISCKEQIFKFIACGRQAIIFDNKDNISRLYPITNELISEVSSISSLFNKVELKGYKPVAYTLSGLEKLNNGNIGLPTQERVSGNSSVPYTITCEYQNKYDYAIAAVVFNNINDISVIGDSISSSISLLYNYGVNENFRNIVDKGVVKIDESTVLVYQVSGRIADKNNELPTTAYVRLAPNQALTFAVSKLLVLEIEEWKKEYINILKKNATNSSVWADVNKLSILETKSIESLGRNLFSGIAFWGSSSTEGAWVQNVANNLDMPYYWGGSGGENIWAIMGRMGVLPMRIKDSFTIPESCHEIVALPNNYRLYSRWKGTYKNFEIWGSKTTPSYKLMVNPCYIAGVKGNIIGGGANSDIPLQFQRLEDGEAVTTKPYEPIYTFGFRETRDCVWFLACHFNGGESSTEELVELYKKMYDVSCSKKVLILGRHKTANGAVTSPTLETLQEQEVALEDEFGLIFFNTREYMCGRGFERFKTLYPNYYTDNDVTLASQGVPPDCMYESASNVHFNSRGYAILEEAITERLIELGYNLFRYGGEIKHPIY